MTNDDLLGGQAVPDLRPFPAPGPMVQVAYRELDLAVNGSDSQRRVIGDRTRAHRPWNPSSTDDPDYLDQVWGWLRQVVVWLNREYTWDPEALIPPCWPEHPHLVRELAVVADQRRRADEGFTSDAIDDWHRHYLPAFVKRMQERLRSHCEDGHQAWPAQPSCDDHHVGQDR